MRSQKFQIVRNKSFLTAYEIKGLFFLMEVIKTTIISIYLQLNQKIFHAAFPYRYLIMIKIFGLNAIIFSFSILNLIPFILFD